MKQLIFKLLCLGWLRFKKRNMIHKAIGFSAIGTHTGPIKGFTLFGKKFYF